MERCLGKETWRGTQEKGLTWNLRNLVIITTQSC